jgi:thiol-disulfide isomerase/thioredoxin
MAIFTKEAKEEIKRYLPHYIVGSAFIVVASICANVLTDEVMHFLHHNDFEPRPEEMQQPMMPQQNQNSIIKPSDFKIGKSYQENMKDKTKPLILTFYVDWCPYSQKITPVLSELEKRMPEANFTTINAELPENEKLSDEYNVNKYPLIYVINAKKDKKTEVSLNETSFSIDGLKDQIETIMKLNK